MNGKGLVSIVMLVAALLLHPALAMAKAQVKVNVTVAKEITVKENGRKVVKQVPAEEIEPGQQLIYTLRYTNTGDETAYKVALVDPVPENTEYVADSASGEGTQITFSIDGGRSYKKPALLTYEVKNSDGTTVKQMANPEQYTHIRWVVATVPTGGEGIVSFRARVK